MLGATNNLDLCYNDAQDNNNNNNNNNARITRLELLLLLLTTTRGRDGGGTGVAAVKDVAQQEHRPMAAAESVRVSVAEWEGEVAAASPAGRREVAVSITAEETHEQLKGTAGFGSRGRRGWGRGWGRGRG
jgi:hypothetical protein